MEHNRLTVAVALVVAGLVAVAAIGPRLLDRATADDGEGARPRSSTGAGPSASSTDRTSSPLLAGLPLADVSGAASPPEPSQWAGGDGGIPSNTWWSSAVTGPGAFGLWPDPLAVRISELGKVEVAAPALVARSDGSSEAPFTPVLWFEVGADAETAVTASGPLHVVVTVTGSDATVEMTLVAGSPVVELSTSTDLRLTVPGAQPAGDGLVATPEGTWTVAAATVAVGADRVDVGAGRAVLGPVPDGTPTSYAASVAALVDHPVSDTAEELTVSPTGEVEQVLAVTRDGGAPSLWALLPHQQRTVTGDPEPLGTLAAPAGEEPVVAGPSLHLRFAPVPVLWSAVALPEAREVPGTSRASDVGIAGGSYFGGKAAHAAAVAGSPEVAATLAGLADGSHEPSLRWDRRWGAVVMEPAEFGVGTELNDHQLQYGYWVAAAAYEAERDPSGVEAYREAIDLLVADYAGRATLPTVEAALPDRRTWDAYAGHSWASGTQPFAAGNNLESISESSFSWWAAARWLRATGRADRADVFVARLTIETAVAADRWLPAGPSLAALPAGARPWSGVVWSGKSDLTTWFDPAPESALGIRLLPAGPAALSRYGSPDAVEAASARWDWCDDHGGCDARWADLLDTDAAVAGRTRLTGPEPEGSTPAAVLAWWRSLWESTEPVFDVRCSVGVVVRSRRADGALLVLASSPDPGPVALSCSTAEGDELWSGSVQGTEAIVLD